MSQLSLYYLLYCFVLLLYNIQETSKMETSLGNQAGPNLENHSFWKKDAVLILIPWGILLDSRDCLPESRG